MGEFRRQPSKVWWLTYEDEHLSLNWGKAVDLSGTFDTINNNILTSNPAKAPPDTAHKEDDPTATNNSRETSSSPSQGSHKSQDSGFSDSEIQNNPLYHSPGNSPEPSERLTCVRCKDFKEEADEKTYNETVVSYRKLKTSVKATEPVSSEGKLATRSDKFLETDFDEAPGGEAADHKHRKNFLKSQFSRTKLDTLDKINQIQNQLELSLKLPKKINLPQGLKIGSLFQGNKELAGDERARGKGEEQQCPDCEPFKMPKVPGEQSMVCKGSTNLLDLTDIGGPPISTSTPKSGKLRGRESPGPRATRALEKKLDTKTTFAAIRRLKAPEKRLRGAGKSVFNRCTTTENVSKEAPDTESALKQWLSELHTMYEAEIMTTLQSKSLATDLTRQVTSMADSTSETVRKLHQKTKIISDEFSKLCQQSQNKKEKHMKSSVQNLVEHLKEFIDEYVKKKELAPQIARSGNQRTQKKSQRSTEGRNCHEMITDFRHLEPETVEVEKETAERKTEEEEVLEACEAVSALVAEDEIDRERVNAEIVNLAQKFTKVVDILLAGHIEALMRVIEEPRTELTLRTALDALTTLGLEGNHLGHLVSKCGGIRILLAVCLEARATTVRVLALRALATVCCLGETIRQFEQVGGVEILADILADKNRCEAELSEAAAVIAQITAPWVKDNHSVEGLSQFLNSLVHSLTRIIGKYKSCETLLLSSAALANLTFMEPRTVWPLLENETVKKLLTAVRRQGPKVSVFIQEQVATVIANMAAVPECRKHLTEQKAVVALLCFLEIHHSPMQRAPEVAAAERVQQKSAIAISRMCSDTVVAKQVIELQGVNRLVRLCKEEKERNHSDGVLVACLAALRKIVANCGTEALAELNAMELVEPRLLDSFLLYSSKQESYV